MKAFGYRQLERRAKHERERKHMRRIIKKEVTKSYLKIEKVNRFGGLYGMLRRLMLQGRRGMTQQRVDATIVKQKKAAIERKKKEAKSAGI